MYVTEIKETQIFVFLLFLSHTAEVYSNHYGVCMFYCIGIYNKHCLPLQKLKNNNIEKTEFLKIVYFDEAAA